MKVLLCLPETPCGTSDDLEKKFEKAVAKNNLQTFRSTEDLSWMLRRPWNRYDIALLVADNKQTLDSYVTLQPLLKDVKVLLVLPNREPATALKGHKLYPRFFSYLDSDPKAILAVLKKMIHNLQSQHHNHYKEVHHDTGHPDHGSGC